MPKFWVWGFYLRGGACYGYDDYLVWGLCVFEPFYRNMGCCGTWITLTPIFVSGTRFVNCYWSVT